MNVTNMSMMFRGCKAKTILFSKNFNTTKVTDMRAMFRFSSVNDFDLTSFDTSNVKYLTDMFKGTVINSGYVRNQYEADKFNRLIGRNLFSVK